MYDAHDWEKVRNAALLISAIAWIFLLCEPGVMAHKHHTADIRAMLLLASPRGVNVPTLMALAMLKWALMLAAMMSPVLISPVSHIRSRSFTHSRTRLVVLFVAGYAVIWMAVGGTLLAVTVVLALSPSQWRLLAAGSLLLAAVWQCSPVKQRCLNRCHTRPALAAFGAASDRDALRFGISHGGWCIGSCWALMLFTAAWPQQHVFTMTAATALIFSERFESPMPPGWRWRGFRRGGRLVMARTRVGLRTVRFRLGTSSRAEDVTLSV